MHERALHIRIGGEAGQGLETLGQMLSKAVVRGGYELLVMQSYMSRIRGGHNYFSIFTGTQEILGPGERIDLLLAFTGETVDIHRQALAEGGLIVSGQKQVDQGAPADLAVPFQELTKKPILQNVAAMGCICQLIGLQRDQAASVVRDTIGSKHGELVEENLQALDRGFEWTAGQSLSFSAALPGPARSEDRLTLNGNQAIALGAMAGGANFCSFYPMTPSTGVALSLIAHAQELGIVVEQVEDEIAAINMGLGASFAGARSIVPTSGGGFALMSEGISLAGMTETPILIVLAQRPGPATGLPTRTEQGDLNLAIFSGHGEFPRAVLAPGTPEECFHLAHLGLNLAEGYQTPVILMTDEYLADSLRSVSPFDLEALPEQVAPTIGQGSGNQYERFALTPSGVSPRRVPGAGSELVVADSDEHTPDGHITEDHGVRTRMVDKRLAKMQGLLAEVRPPEASGPESPDMLLVSWGSTKGVMLQVAEHLRQEGKSVASLHFSQVWPLDPQQFLARLDEAGETICLESNATGQFEALIRQQTGRSFDKSVRRYDGLPLTAAFVLEHLQAGG
jgi:2-oxoglutarate ferredoxin oxidoreductase subunit alpha